MFAVIVVFVPVVCIRVRVKQLQVVLAVVMVSVRHLWLGELWLGLKLDLG